MWESTELCGEVVKPFGGNAAVMLYIKFAGPALALKRRPGSIVFASMLSVKEWRVFANVATGIPVIIPADS